MLKVEFLEDYKIFKKGTKVNFFSDTNMAYNIIGKNETGKSIFLEVLEYAFNTSEVVGINSEISVKIKYQYFDSDDKVCNANLTIESGIPNVVELPENINKILTDLKNLIIVLLRKLKQYNVSSQELEGKLEGLSQKIDVKENNIALINSSGVLGICDALKTKLKTNSVKQMNGAGLQTNIKNGIEQDIDRIKNYIDSNREILNSIEEDSMPKLKFVKVKDVDYFSRIEIKSTYNETIRDLSEKMVAYKLFEALDSKVDMKKFYGDAFESKDTCSKVEEFIEEFNKEFFHYYKNNETSAINSELSFINGNNSYIDFVENETRIEGFDKKSEGFKFWVSMFINFRELEKTKNNLTVLDEPAYNLHLSAQEMFRNYIQERLSKNNVVIWTTHSPSLVTTTGCLKNFIRNGKYVAVSEGFANNFETGELTLNACNLLVNDTNHSIFNAKEKILVLVEGYSDLIIYRRYLELYDKSNYFIIPVGSIQDFLKIIPLLLFYYDDKMLVISDKDDNNHDSSKIKEQLKNYFEIDVIDCFENLEILYPEAEREDAAKNKIHYATKVVRENIADGSYGHVFEEIHKSNIFI